MLRRKEEEEERLTIKKIKIYDAQQSVNRTPSLAVLYVSAARAFLSVAYARTKPTIASANHTMLNE